MLIVAGDIDVIAIGIGMVRGMGTGLGGGAKRGLRWLAIRVSANFLPISKVWASANPVLF
jgi:hypothetical protein